MAVNSYKVIVEGFNFLLPMEEKNKTVGFFCTLLVRSVSVGAIAEEIQPLIASKIKESHLDVKSDFFSFSQIVIESVFPDDNRSAQSTLDGFTFYEMSFFQQIISTVKGVYLRLYSPSRLVELKSLVTMDV